MLRMPRFFLSLIVAGLLAGQLVADPQASAVAVSPGEAALDAAARANAT